jgi:undecaprenyl-diphosphatase
VIGLGLTVQLLPGDTTAELGVDQDISRHHIAALTAVAMGINLVFGPVSGVILIGLIALHFWLVRRDPVKAVAFGLVACSGWVASEAFKLLIGRQRPDPALLFDPLSPETGSNSFPSGHVSFAVALAFAFYFLARGSRWSRVTAIAGCSHGPRRSLVQALRRGPLRHRRGSLLPGRHRRGGPAKRTVEPLRARAHGPAARLFPPIKPTLRT